MDPEEILQWREEAPIQGIGRVGNVELRVFPVGEEIGKIVSQAPIS